jgi:hypothetical protein
MPQVFLSINAETGYLQLKERGPFKLTKKYARLFTKSYRFEYYQFRPAGQYLKGLHKFTSSLSLTTKNHFIQPLLGRHVV